MNEKKYQTPLIIFLFFLLTTTACAAPTGSFPLLKLAPDARSTALGETGTAGAEGAIAAFHNPALLAFSNTSQAAFAYTDWLLDLTIQSGALLFDYSKISVGLSFYSFTTPDLERRVLPSDDPIDTFGAHDIAAGISLAYLLREDLSIGMTARFLYQQIYVEDASGIGADLGIAWRPSWLNLTLAGTIRNVGSMEKLKNEESELPTFASFGIAGVILRAGNLGFRALGDLRYFVDDDLRVHAGIEGFWKDNFFLRAGYQTGSELRTFSGGAGLHWKAYSFDYAYQPLAEDFEAGHRFTLSLNF